MLLACSEIGEDFGAPRLGLILDARVGRAAARIHGDEQRAEALDAETPDAFRVEVVHVDLLDRLDPGGLQRRRAPDHGEVGAANVAEGSERTLPHAALADDDADALALHQRAREARHTLRGGGTNAERLVA